MPINYSLFIELFVAPCKDGKCPLQVRLKYGGEILDTAELNRWQQPAVRQWNRTIWEGYWDRDGDGDPVTFVLGEFGNVTAVTVALQLVKFHHKKWGVLVRQCAGIEHGKSWFTLYEVEEDLFGAPTHKLKKIWEKSEYSGPYASGVVTSYKEGDGMTNKDSDNEVLVYLEGYSNSLLSKDRPDRLIISRLQWSIKKRL